MHKYVKLYINIYINVINFQYRHNLFATWSQHLQQACLQFRQDIARTEYLSNPDERLRWQANALPTDDLCTENAIMLKVKTKWYRRIVNRPKGLI